MSGIPLSAGIKITAQNTPADSKYFNGSEPWSSVSAANTGIESAIRHQGLTVNVNGVEYWYKDGIADNQLVEKTSGGSMTDAEVKTAYENNPDTNAYSDAEKAKLAGLEDSRFKGTYPNVTALKTAYPTGQSGWNAYVDGGVGNDKDEYVWDDDTNDWELLAGTSTAETPASVKTKYEANTDTNVFNDAAKAKNDNLPSNTNQELSNKAPKAGDNSQRFKASPAVDPDDVVVKSQLDAAGSGTVPSDITVVAPAGKLGGYDNGEVVPAGTPLIDVVEKILRDGEPVYFYPPSGSVSSTKAASSLYEIGDQLTMTITHSFNQNDGGAVNNVTYRKDGNTIDPANYNLTIGAVAQIIDALISYDAGSGSKFNEIGEEFPNTIAAGSIDTANLSYAGQYPFFFGKSVSKPTPNQTLINGSTKKTSGSLIVSANGTLNINFGASGEFVWFAIPSTAPAKNTYYKTALDTGNIDLIFDDPVQVSVNSPDGKWTGVTYNFYISSLAGTHNTNMELRN